MEAVKGKGWKPPRLSHLFAVSLELGMLGVFMYERSWVGLLIAVPYSWYSATWALVVGTKDEP